MSIFTYQKLHKAYLDCRKNKRKNINALKFEINFEDNLRILLDELQKKTYRPRRSICFVVTEPKPREIFAADFRDRIVHHLLVSEIEEYFEKRFIYDSYASRKGKGTHRAVARLCNFLKRKENKEAWYLKMDIKSFFMSIDKNVLYKLVTKSLVNRNLQDFAEIDWLLKIVIFYDPTKNYLIRGDKNLFKLIPDGKSLFGLEKNKGLPIGNYSSQFFANVYLNELDQFIKRELKSRFYIRYVDDFILFSEDKDDIIEWRDKIIFFVMEKLNMRVCHKKTIIQKVGKGIDFLGYFVKSRLVYPRRSVFKRYKNRLFRIAIRKEFVSLKYIKSMHSSYLGCFGFRG